MFASYKHYYLLGTFVSYEENEVFWIRPLDLTQIKFMCLTSLGDIDNIFENFPYPVPILGPLIL